MVEIIKRNRALAYLKTHNYDAALKDTGYPALDVKSSEKALFRAAEALYHLRQFEECLDISKKLITGHPNLPEAQALLNRTQNRVQEGKNGGYDFARLQRLAQQPRPPHLDQATYIGPIEVKQTVGKGRGVFLTKAVKAGDLLLCEKAFSHAHIDNKSSSMTMLMYPETNRGVMGGQANLIKQIAQKIQNNPSVAPEFTALYSGKYPKVDVTEVDGQPIVDT